MSRPTPTPLCFLLAGLPVEEAVKPSLQSERPGPANDVFAAFTPEQARLFAVSAILSRHQERMEVQGQLGLSPSDLCFRGSWALRHVAWEDGFLAQTPPSTDGAAGVSDSRVPKPRIPEWSSPRRIPNFRVS